MSSRGKKERIKIPCRRRRVKDGKCQAVGAEGERGGGGQRVGEELVVVVVVIRSSDAAIGARRAMRFARAMHGPGQ